MLRLFRTKRFWIGMALVVIIVLAFASVALGNDSDADTFLEWLIRKLIELSGGWWGY